jgi:hypothetical protein
MDDLIGVPVVGQPVVYAAGFLVLLLLAFTGPWARSLVTVTHEGGHMLVSVLTLRGFHHFELKPNADGVTWLRDGSWGVGDLLMRLSGYLAPPVVGLIGASVLANGNAWGVLAAAAFLLLVSFLYAHGALANVITALALIGVIAVLWRGSQTLQVATAAAAVWLLLLGGLIDAVRMSRTDGADADMMARRTWIPAIVWQAFWVTVSLVCLYAGGRLLFVGDAWPDGVWPFDARA